MSEYLAVKEFSEKAGVTITAVYNRINNRSLDDYIKVEKGVKVVSTDALDLFTPRKSTKFSQQSSDNIMQLESQGKMIIQLESTITILSNEVELLGGQLKAKDNQIAELNDQIKQLNEHLKFSNGLVDQSQRLNAAEKVEKIITLAENVDSGPAKKTLREKLMFWK